MKVSKVIYDENTKEYSFVVSSKEKHNINIVHKMLDV